MDKSEHNGNTRTFASNLALAQKLGLSACDLKNGILFVWTRSADEHDLDSELWRKETSMSPLFLPCLASRPFPKKSLLLPMPLARESSYGVIVTSPRAVSYASKSKILRPILENARDIITHGAKTALALKEKNFKSTLAPQVRTAKELCEWIVQNIDLNVPMYYLGAEEPAYDLVTDLRSKGFRVDKITCYQSVEGVLSRDEPKLKILCNYTHEAGLGTMARLPAVFCFASPTAIRGLMKSTYQLGLRPLEPIGVAVIGPTTAEEARKSFKNVCVASENSVKGLITAALQCALDAQRGLL